MTSSAYLTQRGAQLVCNRYAYEPVEPRRHKAQLPRFWGAQCEMAGLVCLLAIGFFLVFLNIVGGDRSPSSRHLHFTAAQLYKDVIQRGMTVSRALLRYIGGRRRRRALVVSGIAGCFQP